MYTGCSMELMSALVSRSGLLVMQVEIDVYSMLRKVMHCSVHINCTPHRIMSNIWLNR